MHFSLAWSIFSHGLSGDRLGKCLDVASTEGIAINRLQQGVEKYSSCVLHSSSTVYTMPSKRATPARRPSDVQTVSHRSQKLLS